MEYKTKGVCSMAIQYDIDDEQKVHNVKFIGGCSGNTQGVAKLVDFWNVDSACIKFDVTGGVNEVLVNTEKGRKLFVLIRENAVYQPVSKAAGWQPHLEYSTKAPGNQEAFWTEYSAAADLKTKEALLRKYMKGSPLTRIIRKVNPILQKTGLYSIAGKMYKKVFVKK